MYTNQPNEIIMQKDESGDITVPRAEYTARQKSLEKNRRAIAGARAVRAAGTECLEPLPSMRTSIVNGVATVGVGLTAAGKASFDKYLSNAAFIGFTGQTVTGLKGLIKSKAPVVELPAALEYLISNADGAGTSLNDFADNCISDSFPSVWSGLLVSAPETDGTNSKLDDEKGNVMPTLAHYSQESIINWHYETVNNKNQLTMLVLREAVSKRNGFKVETGLQYRLLELINGVYHQATYDKDGDIITELSPVVINGKQLDRIPFRVICTSHGDKSVIDDLVDANFEHYNLYADYGNKLHESSFVVWYEVGIEDGQASSNCTMGPGTKWNGGQGAGFGVLQADGNADSHRIGLKDTEYRLSTLGADMLKESSAAESGAAKALDKVSTNSTTIDVANTISAAITSSIQDIADLLGVSGDISYKLNTDYDPSGMSGQDLTAYVSAWHMGAFDKAELDHKLQRGEVIRADTDLKVMNKNIDNEQNGLGGGAE